MCFKLVAHLLDLRGLRFGGFREGLNFLLLLRDGRFQVMLLAVLFLSFDAPLETHSTASHQT